MILVMFSHIFCLWYEFVFSFVQEYISVFPSIFKLISFNSRNSYFNFALRSLEFANAHLNLVFCQSFCLLSHQLNDFSHIVPLQLDIWQWKQIHCFALIFCQSFIQNHPIFYAVFFSSIFFLTSFIWSFTKVWKWMGKPMYSFIAPEQKFLHINSCVCSPFVMCASGI